MFAKYLHRYSYVTKTMHTDNNTMERIAINVPVIDSVLTINDTQIHSDQIHWEVSWCVIPSDLAQIHAYDESNHVSREEYSSLQHKIK